MASHTATWFIGKCGLIGCDALVGHYHGQEAVEAGSILLGPSAPPAASSALPSDPKARKALPIWTGVMLYFPAVWAEVARVSKLGNEQHNPGEPLHWDRSKSKDQMDAAFRHMLDYSCGKVFDEDGSYTLAKAIWRLCAELQLTIEKERG